MGILSKIFKMKESELSPPKIKYNKPKFLSKNATQSGTYEVYKAKDAESAKQFLLTRKVDEQQYYIIVETPDGNWGLDIKGLFLEHLEQFQKNVSAAQCTGFINGMPDMFSLEMAAKGYNDNFTVNIVCGNCKYEWLDRIRYQQITVVRCPYCRILNRVDSAHFHVHLTG